MAYEGLRRNDVMLEHHGALDGGAYESEWMETAGVSAVAVTAQFNDSSPTPYIAVQHGQYDANIGGSGPRVIRTTEVPVEVGPLNYADIVDLSTRYFRVVASAETDSTIAVSVRAVN